jgi:putative ABC transport system permease protein
MRSRISSMCRNLFRRQAVEQELDDELRSALEILVAQKIKDGIPPEVARREALIELGGLEQVKEEVRSAKAGRWLEDFLLDIRFGMRLLRRNRGFTIVAVVILALGIGATTAIFSVVETVVIRPLPYPESDRLMAVLSTSRTNRNGFLSAPGVYLDWRIRSKSFEVMAGARGTVMDLSGMGQPQTISVARTSTDLFPLLGIKAVFGRLFTENDDRGIGHRVALLDDGFWRRQFGGDKDVLGKSLVLNGTSHEIIGVIPETVLFDPFRKNDVYLPLGANPRARTGGDIVVVGRLRPGIPLSAAQAEMQAVMSGIGRDHIEDSRTGVLVKPLRNWIVGDMKQVFLVASGLVGFLMLICCANIANLLMIRATARSKEMTIRTSLGATRLRLVRQTMAESVLLSSIGGIGGLGVAVALIQWVPFIRAIRIPRIHEISVDASVLAIAAGMSIATGILFGLAPALQARRTDLLPDLRASMHSQPKGRRIREALVIAQLALALVLLTGAGLMANSLLRLLNIDLGFERSNVITVNTSFSRKYEFSDVLQFQRKLAENIGRIPGVESASASDYVPLMSVLFPLRLKVPAGSTNQEIRGLARHIDPNYFDVLRIPLLLGRDLTWSDDGRRPVPALISRNTARILFGSENPIGRNLLTGYRDLDPLEVVGVVGDAHQLGVTQESGRLVYLPLAQSRSAQYVIARTSRDPDELSAQIRSTVYAMDPELPVPVIGTIDEWYSRELARPRFYFVLIGAFAGFGLILAAVGTYGVISYGVVLRTQELGIRIALGARTGDILRLTVGNGIKILLIGIALGLCGSLALTRLISTFLYEVRPNDPLTFTLVVLFLAATSLLACYLAARKALGIDPNQAIKCE